MTNARLTEDISNDKLAEQRQLPDKISNFYYGLW